MPQSVMVWHAGLFEALKNTPRISGIGTFNHQGMPLGHTSSRDAFHQERYLPTHSCSCLSLHSPLLCAAYSSFRISLSLSLSLHMITGGPDVRNSHADSNIMAENHIKTNSIGLQLQAECWYEQEELLQP